MALEQASSDPWRSLKISLEHLKNIGLAD